MAAKSSSQYGLYCSHESHCPDEDLNNLQTIPAIRSGKGPFSMSVLSAQSIRRLCRKPLIDPCEERGVVDGKSFGLSACTYDCRIAQDLDIPALGAALASTIERFCLPDDICGSVLDKSSWARVFVSAFNTHLDPGWEGFLTV